ncbi:LCP family protein, partial [Kribbia dieselivorans]|uniref:LCP family protein n=1 Tax=Kribbia dieselivorans TaxID=331526 RepID=UPI000B0A0052
PRPANRPRPVTPRPTPLRSGTGRSSGGMGVGGGGAAAAAYPAPRGPRSAKYTVRRIMVILIALLLVYVIAMIWAVNSAWGQVGRVDATPGGQRAAAGQGRNILMVGSDSRSGMSKAERNKLGTGTAEGARTDSIMVLHTGSGDPTLISIPRDSYVEIPGNGLNKINAAFAIGGPKLLAETIEHNADIRIDGYMEIGFGGFATVVDAVGGVRMCLKAPMKDEKAHIDLPKGCQVLDGPNALGYVRARYSDPKGDLGRVERQRQFLGALMGKMASPSNVLLPWRVHSLGGATASAVSVGQDDSMIDTLRAGLAMRTVAGGGGNSVTVPLDNENLATAAGSAVHWDPAASKALFTAIRNDEPLSVKP